MLLNFGVLKINESMCHIFVRCPIQSLPPTPTEYLKLKHEPYQVYMFFSGYPFLSLGSTPSPSRKLEGWSWLYPLDFFDFLSFSFDWFSKF